LLNQAINDNMTDVQVNLILRRVCALHGNSNNDDAAVSVSDTSILQDLLPRDAPVLENFMLLARSLSSWNHPAITTAGSSPAVVSFPALVALLGIAQPSSNRHQRLQLLFYLLADDLAEKCLQTTTAVWLLEVGTQQVLDIDSLIHYQTHGTAFLPTSTDRNAPFVEDPLQPPVSVQARRILELATPTAMKGKTTDLMRRLQMISDGTNDDPYDVDAPSFVTTSIHSESEAMWTLQDFAVWAQDNLEDKMLDVIFHKLLLQGVLPSPFMELDLVRTLWVEWQNGLQQKSINEKPRQIGNLGETTTLCCMDKAWWDQWVSYVGWTFQDDEAIQPQRSRSRPPAISNQRLWDTSRSQHGVKVGLWDDAAYMPPCVWDCLYELYGGGPPILCSVLPIESGGKALHIACPLRGPEPGTTVSPLLNACGLENLGRSAWMSVVIQCVNATPLLRSYLLNDMYEVCGHLNRDNPLGSRGRIIEALANVLKAMRSSKGVYRPAAFGEVVTRVDDQFRVTAPNFVKAFLDFVMEAIHEDANLVRNKPYVEALEEDWIQNNSLEEVESVSWRRYGFASILFCIAAV